MAWLSDLSESLGAPEAGLRLILGQLAGYPIFFLYRLLLQKSSSTLQHLYFLATGVFMGWWAIGEETILHSTICILFTYLVLKFAGRSSTTAIFLFIFNLVYLFVGYFFNASKEYDITWTMPQCVLCLRLIGLSMDVCDGSKDEAELSKDQKMAALKELPSLLECFSHSFFIGGYFVGPQFSMRKFRDFVQRNQTTDMDTPIGFGLRRLALGGLYFAMHMVGSGYVPENWVLTSDFEEMRFLPRSFWFFIWAKAILAKYIGAWLLAEGACIISGLAYNGEDAETKQVKWNGGANVKLRLYETPRQFNHIIESFNINTNAWVASYVYKRLRFLNNRQLSQFGALAFLACWHGYHSGYYLTFFNEFIVMNFEKEFVSILKKSELAQRFLNHPVGSLVGSLVGLLYVAFWLPYCFFAFPLLKRQKYMQVIYSTNGLLYIFFLSWYLWRYPFRMIMLGGNKKKEEEKKSQ